MTKRSETNAPIKIRLDIDIDADDMVRVSFLDSTSRRIRLHPGHGLADLLPDGSDGPISLEVNDFFQRGTVYEVFAAILEDDGHTIAAHWQPTESGQQYALPPLSKEDAARIKLLIGALPRRKDAVVPTPLAPKPRVGRDRFGTAIDPPPKDPLASRLPALEPPLRETSIDPPPKGPEKRELLRTRQSEAPGATSLAQPILPPRETSIEPPPKDPVRHEAPGAASLARPIEAPSGTSIDPPPKDPGRKKLVRSQQNPTPQPRR